MRRNYWSCSQLADWIRGTPKLTVGTSQAWREWRTEAQQRHPVRFWIAEQALDWLQDWVYAPADVLSNVRSYINNRWVTRSHALVADSRDIKPGTWRDLGDRLLPCMFNALVEFVEVEQAWHHVIWDKEAGELFAVPWYIRMGFGRWRSAPAGLAYLDWAASRVHDETDGVQPGSADYGQPTSYALAAREIKALYTWWKEVYPQRPDAHDASGWTDYCASRHEKGHDLLDMSVQSEADANHRRAVLDQIHAIEQAYADEDQEMMTRLIKVRNALWT